MKTKHLLYSLAFVGTFAACTNEDFVGNAPQENNAARPTVSGVTIETGNAETRLSYGEEGFNWEEGDKLAVLLMDENNTGVRYGSATATDKWNGLTWLERYHLVDYVHTNYPFENDGSGKFKTPANMLEGNYFLAYPYVSFDGKRQAYFEIAEQKQVGNTGEARMKAYADNQHFIGYARLDAAEGASSLKANMVEVLAPIRINLGFLSAIAAGDKVTVNKIVLEHPDFCSQYTIDPTDASYGEESKWNLQQAEAVNDDNAKDVEVKRYFNYANLLGMQNATAASSEWEKELYFHEDFGSVAETDYVWNIDENEKGDVKESRLVRRKAYYYDDALRAMVKPLNKKKNWTENTMNCVEVYTYEADGETPMELKQLVNEKENMLGIVAMVPALTAEQLKEYGLDLYIHTNRGLVGPIDLTERENGEQEYIDIQTTDAMTAGVDPAMKMKTVTVLFSDVAIKRVPTEMTVNSTSDLEEYVKWATTHPTDQKLIVTLTNDVTIDDELAAAIKLMKADHDVDDAKLWIRGAEGSNKACNLKLDIRTEDQANILEYIDIANNKLLVEIVGGSTVSLTEKAHNYRYPINKSKLNFLVDKDGVLNVKDSNNSAIGGWSTVNNNVAEQYVDVKIKNFGTVNVNADVNANAGIWLENSGELNVNGNLMLSRKGKEHKVLSVNTINGVINVNAGGVFKGTTEGNIENYGVINNAGEVYNVANLAPEPEKANIKPGMVVITAADALTTLDKNFGIVKYEKLPAVPVKVREAADDEGMYTFEGDTITLADVKTHRITDLTIVSGTFNINETNDKTATLRHLILKEGSKIEGGSTNKALVFAAPLGEASTISGCAWNGGKLNTLTAKEGGVLNAVTINLKNENNSKRDQIVFSGKKKFQFMGEVKLYSTNNDRAPVLLRDTRLVVTTGATLTAGSFYAPGNPTIKSDIEVQTGGTFNCTDIEKDKITVSGEMN